ncbi:hypothetical protein SAMN04488021_11233 [Paracoccus aminovorans]|uniref:Uncharacterized protein n=1 Tax=Paracoccus aminovorans TaxID=34004 RepID=A0A1I3A202_9RHOB|nr:hypothetical protein [Paracoccus aminovorans]CQR85032.1 putative membrane protein [Paracoccus aminovorans]SFH44182.1 hypothetical protein SAMN04488021_11233 [Paracoccus aminovorans]
MLIRIILRTIPLACVTLFTLAVYLTDTPLDRARALSRLDHGRLAWAEGLVKCPAPWANLPVSACPGADHARIPPPPH